MRLWHYKLISYLPCYRTTGDRKKNQLLGQHRECCALRGNGWGTPHSVVDYVFRHPPAMLVKYHFMVINELEKRGYCINPLWKDARYRGPNAAGWAIIRDPYMMGAYPEHDEKYLISCLDNLKGKGIIVELNFLKTNDIIEFSKGGPL